MMYGPTYIQWPLRQVRLADIAAIDMPQDGLTINRRHAARALAWAPEGVLRLAEPSQHSCRRAGVIEQAITFMTGCLVGAAMMAAPIYTAIGLVLMATLLPTGRAPAAA